MKQLTYHGKRRVKERIEINERKAVFVKRVSRDGKTPNMYRGDFYRYLCSKDRGAHIKVYKGYIYILSKTSRKLITMYKVPSKYLPTEMYEIPKEVVSKAMMVNSFLDRKVCVNLKDGSVYKGYILEAFIANETEDVSFICDDKVIYLNVNEIVKMKWVRD